MLALSVFCGSVLVGAGWHLGRTIYMVMAWQIVNKYQIWQARKLFEKSGGFKPDPNEPEGKGMGKILSFPGISN